MSSPHLPRRTLGATDIEVSVIGLGTVKFGRNQALKYPRAFTLPDDRSLKKLLALAQDMGVNLLDTAPAYGESEQRLGALIAGQRDRWIIATKAGEEFTNGASSFDFSPEHLRYSVERSLARLGTDRIDIVLVHSDGDDDAILDRYGSLEVLEALKAEGKIRAVGLSHKTVNGGIRAASHCDLIMSTLNAGDLTQLPAIKAAADLGCGVLVKKSLASGRAVASKQERGRYLRFAVEQTGVTSVVVGTIDAAHLEDNITAVLAGDPDCSTG